MLAKLNYHNNNVKPILFKQNKLFSNKLPNETIKTNSILAQFFYVCPFLFFGAFQFTIRGALPGKTHMPLGSTDDSQGIQSSRQLLLTKSPQRHFSLLLPIQLVPRLPASLPPKSNYHAVRARQTHSDNTEHHVFSTSLFHTHTSYW